MKKNAIKLTFILLFYSTLAKILSFVVRIYLARKMSLESMNYYSLTMPTMLLLITLAQMGIPNALAKTLSANHEAKKTIKASIFISLINNLLLFVVILLIIPILSFTVFKDANLIAVFVSCLPMIPLVTLSGILKGYLMGSHQLITYTKAQVSEECFRFLFLIFTLPMCSNPIILAKLAILSMAVGEIASSIHMVIAIGIKRKRNFRFLLEKSEKSIYTALLSVALLMTLSRLVGSISFFLEPIAMLLNVSGANKQIMIDNFSSINAYVLPILTLPSFITLMISNWALPVFSEAYSQRNYKKLTHTFFMTCSLGLVIGSAWSLITFLFPNSICNLLYNQDSMSLLLKQLSIPFSIYSIQPILTSFLHATNKSKSALFGTLWGCICRLLLIMMLPLYTIDLALVISLCLSMLITTFYHTFHCTKILFLNHI